MPARDDGDIINAFNEKLRTYDGGSWNAKTEFQNDKNFNPPSNSTYLRTVTTFQTPRLIGQGPQGHYKILGTYYINIMVPKGGPLVPAYNLAGGLVDHFKRGITLTKNSQRVTIDSSYYGLQAEDDDHVLISVSVDFYTYTLY